ncbi:MAG TPA: 50S ribosomal protein L18 [Deltaproteobacteria bacterium]|nr:50S ribosomal protein L18 [Deltaproteobacteria bacterium]
MSHGPRYHIKPRRRREGKTDYRKRLALLKSGKTRIVVRKSLKNIRVQFIDYDEQGDRVVASALATELSKKYKWKYSTSTTPAAYLTGLLAATRAKEKGVAEGVLDIGRQLPVKGSKVFAALKGVLDAGITCPHSEDTLPDEERILGVHLNENIKKDVPALKTKIIGGE